jgi:hypothetical protein
MTDIGNATPASTATHMCQLCLEPGYMADGVFIHQFTRKPACTYKSHL